MLAAGRKTLTEVFDLTFLPLLAGSSSAHTHTQTRTILNLRFSLPAWISPRNMEMHLSHRGLSSQKWWFAVAECGCTHKLLYPSPPSYMYVCFWVLWYNLCEPPTLFFVTLEHSSLYNSFAFVSPIQLRTISTCYWAMKMLQAAAVHPG